MSRNFLQQGLRFACTGCGGCCVDPNGFVFCTSEEALSISQFLNISQESFLRNYLEPDSGDQWQLRSKPDGACIFLDGQGCRIYPVRPLQCRTYPFWPENIKSHYRWNMITRQCPGINQGRTYSAEEIRQLARQMKKSSSTKD